MGLRRGHTIECPLLLPFRATPQRQPCIGNSGDAPALLVHRRSFRVGLKDYVAEWQPYECDNFVRLGSISMEWTVVLAGLARKLLKAHSSHQPERESIFSLCLPIPVPVGSAVSKPCRPASTARGLVVARSCAFAGKENVRGSNSSRAGPHPANRCIVCRSVLLAAQNQWKSTLQTHTRKEQTGERMSSSIRQATQLVDCRNESVTSHESRTLQSRFIYAHQNSLCLR